MIDRDPVQMLYDFMKNNEIVQKSIQADDADAFEVRHFKMCP